jgi:GNAT superfamily N-acetyltransferase
MDVEALPPNSTLEVFTAAERPDLWEDARQLFLAVWPEYNQHGTHAATILGALVPDFAHLQVLLYDRDLHRIVARGRTIPFRWDGTREDLPSGFDALGLRALGDRRLPTALSALAAEVETDQQGRGLSRMLIQAMAACANAAGLHQLVAPVRPNWKERHPLVPIEEYAGWVRDDGLPYDPWMRVHSRLGATVLRSAPESFLIEAPASDWEEWTGISLRADGDYVFPSGLAPLHVRDGVGTYWEPNVWMLHEL